MHAPVSVCFYLCSLWYAMFSDSAIIACFIDVDVLVVLYHVI